MSSPLQRRRHHAVVGGTAALAFLVLLGFQAGESVDAPAIAPAATTVPERSAPAVPLPSVPPAQVVPPGRGFVPRAAPPERFVPRRFRRGGPGGGRGFGAPAVPSEPDAATPDASGAIS